MKGEMESIQETTGQIGLMLLLAVAFMYLIMVAQFQSLKSPLSFYLRFQWHLQEDF